MKSTPNLLATHKPADKSSTSSSQLFGLKNGKVSKNGKTDPMRKSVLRNCHEKGRLGPSFHLSCLLQYYAGCVPPEIFAYQNPGCKAA
jgi:hypothetical protein